MFTHSYKGAFIHGYFNRPECRVSAFGVPATKVFRSYRAAQLAVTRAVKAHDAAMVELATRDRAARTS